MVSRAWPASTAWPAVTATALTRPARPALTMVLVFMASRVATLVSASSLEKSIGAERGGNREAARLVGEEIAKRAKEAGVDRCYLDRGGCLYHGRVKALADAARGGGLEF